MYRIYIIEDEEAIASAIKNNLEKWGFRVKCAEDFRNITEEFSAFSPQSRIIKDTAFFAKKPAEATQKRWSVL